MHINAQFDAGNIEVLNLNSANNIQLALRKDAHASFSQWFYFRVTGAKDADCQLNIMNASEASYVDGWKHYRAVASYDRNTWFRVPTSYDGKILTISHRPEHDSIYYAYFAPYSYEQHLNLLSFAQSSSLCEIRDLGLTLDQHPITLLTIGPAKQARFKCWIIARQHAGETMAEWFIEGFLQRLLDRADPIAKTLLKQTVFYVVPNMNPDGSVRGHLRANAAGIDLNRSWCAPSLEKSPEVFYVRQKMRETGVDLFLDIHGDEVIPYNFVAGAADNPSYSAKQAKLENTFISYFLQQSPDFQNEHGYGVRQFGEHTLTLATNYVADTFGCLALTVEMPFKDNANLPDEKYGWSPLRAKKLASACLDTIHQVVPLIA